MFLRPLKQIHFFALTTFLFVRSSSAQDVKDKPNIVIILADDLGSYDISLSGNNEFLTPNIDALGYQGVVFNRHYTQAMCSPSRAALLTGKYPIHTGMQHYVILPDEPRGLPLSEKLLPEYLREVGYKTHIVGKWHLGFARRSFTPTHRGFDTHFGFYNGGIDYINYTLWFRKQIYEKGFDFRRNEEVYRDIVGQYLPDVITDEATKVISDHDPNNGPLFMFLSQHSPHASSGDVALVAIPEDLETVDYIKDPDRRTYAAMVKALDRSVGKVVTALKEKGMLENTIILFSSDNGAPESGLLSNSGSNYPLRGQKDSPWEGGVRTIAAVWSPLFEKRHYVSSHLVHITDWLPTFLQVSGATTDNSENLDGFDIWSTLSHNHRPVRREMVINIDPIVGYTSYYYNGYKVVNGTTSNGVYDSWLRSRNFDISPDAPSYADIVMNSPVWQALNPYATRPLQPRDVDEIRSKTKITCHTQYRIFNTCNPLKAPCLFYLDGDPCEMNNLAHFLPLKVASMRRRVKNVLRNMVPPGSIPVDPNANPALNDGLWTWWLDRED